MIDREFIVKPIAMTEDGILNLPAYGDDSSLSALTFIPPVILA